MVPFSPLALLCVVWLVGCRLSPSRFCSLKGSGGRKQERTKVPDSRPRMQASRDIQKILELLKVASCIDKNSGFSALTGLSYQRICSLPPGHLSFQDATLKLKLPLDSRLHLPYQDNVGLATFLSIIDDVTTWGLVLSDPARSRAGVSVSLKLESGPAASKVRSGDSVNVISRTKKIGRNLGFVEAEVRDAASDDLVCFGSHVKYLPMGYLADFALSSYGWPLVKMYAEYSWSSQDKTNHKLHSFADAFDSFHMNPNESKATFVVDAAHNNLSGSLHGGCVAVLMELAATEVAKRELSSSQVVLKSISIEYLSPSNSKDVELEVERIQRSEGSITMRVELKANGKLKGLGILSIAAQNAKSDVIARL